MCSFTFCMSLLGTLPFVVIRKSNTSDAHSYFQSQRQNVSKVAPKGEHTLPNVSVNEHSLYNFSLHRAPEEVVQSHTTLLLLHRFVHWTGSLVRGCGEHRRKVHSDGNTVTARSRSAKGESSIATSSATLKLSNNFHVH